LFKVKKLRVKYKCKNKYNRYNAEKILSFVSQSGEQELIPA